MIILTIRTDKPEAEVGLFDDRTQVAYEVWQAHRQLAETIHIKIRELLQEHGYEWKDIEGVIAFQGPGSFTGLRIGLTVANALAYAQSLPIVASMNELNGSNDLGVENDLPDGATDDHWISNGINRLLQGENDTVAMPEYGAEANITKPKS
jgi:tRNA threonylcarbamoyladenosine biosynthesis protein TsaB